MQTFKLISQIPNYFSTSYSVRLKLFYYVVAKTEMSKNLIKIAKVNFASTTPKQVFATRRAQQQ